MSSVNITNIFSLFTLMSKYKLRTQTSRTATKFFLELLTASVNTVVAVGFYVCLPLAGSLSMSSFVLANNCDSGANFAILCLNFMAFASYRIYVRDNDNNLSYVHKYLNKFSLRRISVKTFYTRSFLLFNPLFFKFIFTGILIARLNHCFTQHLKIGLNLPA